MAEPLPEPLTPADCDLRAFRDMPLDVQRFRDSDLLTDEEPEVVLAAITLWGNAWHQVPAASLPNNDGALAKFAGYGRSLVAWRAVREGALRGFVLCSDGRLYHRVLAQKAQSAWAKRLEHEWSKAKDRHRKAMKDVPEHERTEFPDLDRWISSRAHGCKADAITGDLAQKRQSELPLESHGNSSGTSSERTHARSERARTGAITVPTGNSSGNGADFQRNGPAIPVENALKGKEGKGLESTQPNPSHNNPQGEEPDDGSGRDGNSNSLAGADLLTLYEAVCDAAGFHPKSPERIALAQNHIADWREAGYDFDLIVIPTIKAFVAKAEGPTRTLGRFGTDIAHEHAKMRAKPKGRYKPPVSPILEPEGEDERFRPIRLELLERLGPASYSTVANEVRFEHLTDVPEHRCPVLNVRDLKNGRPAIAESSYRSVLRNIAFAHGYKEVWP